MTADDDYEYVDGWYRYRKGSNPDRSRKSAGAWRGTTRGSDGHLDGQAEFIPDYDFYGDFDDAYEYVRGEYRFQRGSRPDQSRETEGAWRGTTRDEDGNLNGQAEFFPGDEDDPYETVSVVEGDARAYSPPVPEYVIDESAAESAPDVSRLVPLALVALAGIAVGVVGVKAAQHVKRQKAAARLERQMVAPGSAVPAGWYATAHDPTWLRYWNGVAWTSQFAQRQVNAPRIAPDWYPDPMNGSQVRFWDGGAWTHHVAPRQGVTRAIPDWYPDPSSPSQWRFWDGTAWTHHVAPGYGAPAYPAEGATSHEQGRLPATPEQRITMSSAEWQAHVRAWMAAGEVQQQLWRRLTNAHISDADDNTLEFQREMEHLTAEQGSQRIRMMLDANPSWHDPAALLDFLQAFGRGQGVPVSLELVERASSRSARGKESAAWRRGKR